MLPTLKMNARRHVVIVKVLLFVHFVLHVQIFQRLLYARLSERHQHICMLVLILLFYQIGYLSLIVE